MPTFPTPYQAYFGSPATEGYEPQKSDLVKLLVQTQSIATVQTLKGFVSAVGDLPSSGNTDGDVYAVQTYADNGGGLYRWEGAEWVLFSALPSVLTTDEYAIRAEAAADEADASADSAVISAQQAQFAAEIAGAPLFLTEADGIAGVADGDLFLVYTSSGVAAFTRDGATAIPADPPVVPTTPSGAIVSDGTLTSITINGVYTDSSHIQLYVGGVLQPSRDEFYTVAAGATTTVVTFPPVPGGLEVYYIAMRQIAVPVAAPDVIEFPDTSTALDLWRGVTPYLSRDIFLAADIAAGTLRAGWMNSQGIFTGVIRDDVDGAIGPTADGGMWAPDGIATPLHYGMSLGTSYAVREANNVAFLACASNHPYMEVPDGYWRFERDLILDGLGGLVVQGQGRPTLAFQTSNVVNGITMGPTDLSSTDFSGSLRLRDLNIVGPGVNHLSGSGLWLNHTNGSRIDRVTVQQFHSCYRVSGGQFNTFSGVSGFGRPGEVADTDDGSSIFWVENYVSSGGTIRPSFTCTLKDFLFGGGDNETTGYANTQDVLRIEAGDDFTLTGGYISAASRSLVYVKVGDYNIAQINLSHIYLDGRRYGAKGKAPHNVYVDDAGGSGNINSLMLGSGVRLANAVDDSLVVETGSNLKRLILDGSIFSGGTGKAALIEGSTGTDGLHIMGSGADVYAMSEGFYVNNATSVVLNATFAEVDDATSALSLTGTIQNLQHAVTFANCVSGLVNTSTGLANTTEYNFIKNGEAFPTIEFDGASVGVTYSTSSCNYTVIGRRVFFDALVILTAKGTSTGEVRLNLNMPFSYRAADSSAVSVSFNNLGRTSADAHAQAEVLNNSSSIRLSEIRDSGTTGVRVPYTDVDLTDTTTIYASGSYKI